MANEIFLINGVTKQEKDGTFYYFFPKAIFQVYPDPDPTIAYFRQELLNGQEVKEVTFDEITDKLGAADIVAYVDKLATDGYFFDNSASGGGGGGDASAANQLTQIGHEAAIETNTDKLDVLLSTRASESTLGTIKGKTDNLDVLLSTRASETTIGSVKTNTDNLDTPLSGLNTNLSNIKSGTDKLSTIETNTAITSETPSFTIVTTVGSVAAGARSVTFYNDGAASGSVLGATLDKNLSITFTAQRLNTLTAIAYDATGTSFLITETR